MCLFKIYPEIDIKKKIVSCNDSTTSWRMLLLAPNYGKTIFGIFIGKKKNDFFYKELKGSQVFLSVKILPNYFKQLLFTLYFVTCMY